MVAGITALILPKVKDRLNIFSKYLLPSRPVAEPGTKHGSQVIPVCLDHARLTFWSTLKFVFRQALQKLLNKLRDTFWITSFIHTCLCVIPFCRPIWYPFFPSSLFVSIAKPPTRCLFHGELDFLRWPHYSTKQEQPSCEYTLKLLHMNPRNLICPLSLNYWYWASIKPLPWMPFS